MNESNQIICANCGYHNEAGSRFCNLCGRSLSATATSAALPTSFDPEATTMLPDPGATVVIDSAPYDLYAAPSSILPPTAANNPPPSNPPDAANAPTQLYQPAVRPAPRPTAPRRPYQPPAAEYQEVAAAAQQLDPLEPRRAPLWPLLLAGAVFVAAAIAIALLLTQPKRDQPIAVGPTATVVAAATPLPADATATSISLALLSPTALEALPTVTAIPSTDTPEPPTSTPVVLPTATPEPATATAVPPTATAVPPTATAMQPTPTPKEDKQPTATPPAQIKPTRVAQPPDPAPLPGDPNAAPPASINGTISPTEAEAGKRFQVLGRGFNEGEAISYWFTNPQGQVAADSPFTLVDGTNPNGQVRFAFSDGDLGLSLSPGLWGLTMQGQESNHRAIFYFRVLGR